MTAIARPIPQFTPDETPASQSEPPVQAPRAFKAAKPINRYELKYFVPVSVMNDLTLAMRGFTRPDPHDLEGRGYRVYSIYWDSPDYRFFWEKIEGYSERRKLRIRRYGDAPYVFFEIKQRFDRTLQKLRLQYSLEEANRFFDDEREDRWSPELRANPTAREVLLLKHEYNLMPKMAVSYRRRALFGEFEPDLRVTFDTRLMYSDAHLDVADRFDTGKYVVDPRIAVMEVKFSERVPLWLMNLIRRHGLQITRMSKYCTAVDKEYHGGTMTPVV
jgi:hypothetical protein